MQQDSFSKQYMEQAGISMDKLFRAAGSNTVRILTLLIVVNILSIFDVSLWSITGILWLVLLIPVFGALIMGSLIRPSIKFVNWVLFSGGIALAALMFFALLLNTVGIIFDFPVFEKRLMLMFLDTLVIGAVAVWWRATDRTKNKRLFPAVSDNFSKHRFRAAALFAIIPFSILGAIQLNNNGPPFVAIGSLILIILIIVYVSLIAKDLSDEERALSIYAIATSLILSVSMRSNFLLGFDIHQEFQVFNATVQNGLWQPQLIRDAYNSCLSITVLPAVFHSIIPSSPEQVFKFTMQLVGSIIPVIVYALASTKLPKFKNFAYLSALFFIVQGQYIFQFPGLVRQQIAFIFFGLLFLGFQSVELSRTVRNALTLTFGLSLVVSHYSTAYVTLFLLVLLIIIKVFLSRILPIFRRSPITSLWSISPLYVGIIILFAFLWHGQTLQSSGGVIDKITSSLNSLESTLDTDSRSDFVNTTFGIGGYSYDYDTLQNIAKDTAADDMYVDASTKYSVTPASSVGPSPDGTAQSFMYTALHRLIPLISGVILAVGVIFTLVKSAAGKLDVGEGAALIAGSLLFVLLAVLPGISRDYNLERLYQQLLVLLCPAFVYGFLLLARFFHLRKYAGLLICTFIISYLIGTSGLTEKLLYNVSNINLSNSGSTYDNFYTTKSEVVSIKWLRTSNSGQQVIADRYNTLRFKAYSTIPQSQLRQGLLPSQIGQNDIVYSGDTNINRRITTDTYQRNTITYSFPVDFLEANKNVIYSGESSRIFK